MLNNKFIFSITTLIRFPNLKKKKCKANQTANMKIKSREWSCKQYIMHLSNTGLRLGKLVKSRPTVW